MDKLLTYDNVAIVVLVAWVIELKIQIRKKEREVERNDKERDRMIAALLKIHTPIRKVCNYLKTRIDLNETGEFNFSDED